mmetsp:Transcript_33008/g.69475  ORF Transcript_33008/g.69475 Transcript_33008/m.69475 type:complete len:236 (-) Transcript_33008:1168-1875(-)
MQIFRNVQVWILWHTQCSSHILTAFGNKKVNHGTTFIRIKHTRVIRHDRINATPYIGRFAQWDVRAGWDLNGGYQSGRQHLSLLRFVKSQDFGHVADGSYEITFVLEEIVPCLLRGCQFIHCCRTTTRLVRRRAVVFILLLLLAIDLIVRYNMRNQRIRLTLPPQQLHPQLHLVRILGTHYKFKMMILRLKHVGILALDLLHHCSLQWHGADESSSNGRTMIVAVQHAFFDFKVA